MPERRPMLRALFGIYLGGIFATIAYFVVIGLSQH
jgi:hypothetical protein